MRIFRYSLTIECDNCGAVCEATPMLKGDALKRRRTVVCPEPRAACLPPASTAAKIETPPPVYTVPSAWKIAGDDNDPGPDFCPHCAVRESLLSRARDAT